MLSLLVCPKVITLSGFYCSQNNLFTKENLLSQDRVKDTFASHRFSQKIVSKLQCVTMCKKFDFVRDFLNDKLFLRGIFAKNNIA